MRTSHHELLSVREVARRLGVAVRTIWKWKASGLFPPPVRLGPNGRTIRWKAEEINRYIERRSTPS